MGKLLAIAALVCIIAVVESKFSCDKTCSRRRVRICDQNGVRYRNLCEFQKAKKCAGGDPRLIKNNCDKFEQSARNRQANNVNCALSSSEELPSGCYRQKNRKPMQGFTEAPMPTTRRLPPTTNNCDENCPLVFNPVCGSNGITYPSECVLNALDCTNEREAILNGTPYVKIVAVSAGQCPTNKPRTTRMLG